MVPPIKPEMIDKRYRRIRIKHIGAAPSTCIFIDGKLWEDFTGQAELPLNYWGIDWSLRGCRIWLGVYLRMEEWQSFLCRSSSDCRDKHCLALSWRKQRACYESFWKNTILSSTHTNLLRALNSFCLDTKSTKTYSHRSWSLSEHLAIVAVEMIFYTNEIG